MSSPQSQEQVDEETEHKLKKYPFSTHKIFYASILGIGVIFDVSWSAYPQDRKFHLV